MTRLQVFRGDELLVEHRVGVGRTTIGRADHTDLALPGVEISRTHCIVQSDGSGWTIVDRSRHGCHIDGRRVEGRAAWPVGAALNIGPYTLRLRSDELERERAATAAAPVERAFERVDTDGGALRLERVGLRLLAGPEAGARFSLRAPRVGVGGPGSQLVLARDGVELRLFTMITTFGTPYDITTDELRVETFYPEDAASETLLQALA